MPDHDTVLKRWLSLQPSERQEEHERLITNINVISRVYVGTPHANEALALIADKTNKAMRGEFE